MIDGYIALQARLHPDTSAVIFPNAQISFAKFEDDIDRAAWELGELDVGAGEAVSVAIGNPYLQWVGIMALARRGIASASSSATGCRLRLGDDHIKGSSPKLTWRKEQIDRVLRGPQRPWPIAPRDRSQIGRVFQTSGTTGAPKRVAVQWKVLDLWAYSFGNLGADGSWYAGTGLNAVLGYGLGLAAWMRGHATIFGPGTALDGDFLTHLRPRNIALVPYQLSMLVNSLGAEFEQAPLQLVIAGGNVPPELARRTRELLTPDVRAMYGSTESALIAVAELRELEESRNSGGYVVPFVDVEIVDEQGNALPPGELGRVRVRSDHLAAGYVGEPELTAEVFRDGWFLTNDLARMGTDGMLTVEGRFDDLMNIGGHKVMPAWVEAAALGCPGVEEAGAFGMLDEVGLQQCGVALVTGDGFDEAALVKALRSQIRWLKFVHWFLVDQLPRNEMGKLDRIALRETFSPTAPAPAAHDTAAIDLSITAPA